MGYTEWVIFNNYNVTVEVSNITSRSKVDVVYYDGSEFRNDLDSSFLGRQWTLTNIATISASGINGPTLPPELSSDTFQSALWNASGGLSGTKTPPQPTEKTRSQYQYVCSDGSQPVFWEDEVSISNTQPIRY